MKRKEIKMKEYVFQGSFEIDPRTPQSVYKLETDRRLVLNGVLIGGVSSYGVGAVYLTDYGLVCFHGEVYYESGRRYHMYHLRPISRGVCIEVEDPMLDLTPYGCEMIASSPLTKKPRWNVVTGDIILIDGNDAGLASIGGRR